MKKQIITIFCIFLLFSIIGFILSPKIISSLILLFPKGIEIIALNPMEVFDIVLSISLFFGFIFVLPLIFYYIISYIFPALYEHEKALIKSNLALGVILFLLGVVLSGYVYIKYGLQWFNNFNQQYNIQTLWSLSQVIKSLVSLCIVSGILLEFPIIIYQLKVNKIIDLNLNLKSRLIFLFIMFLVIGIITPDGSFITQILLSFPIYILLELSLLMANKKIMESEKKWY